MLSGLLEKHQCAECRFCCVFDKDDFWEMPSLLPDTAEKIKSFKPKTLLNSCDKVFMFDVKNIEGELYPCPALTSNGCGLSSDLKPFECSIWPIRLMKFKGDIVLTVCKDCSALKDIDTQTIDDFANSKVRVLALNYAKKYPSIVKSFHENYRIIYPKVTTE